MDRDTDFVLIHDGARPFVDKEIIDSSIKKAFRYKASVAAVSVKPTIKKIKFMNGEVFARETLKRDSLREIQTPQVFKRELIENAYKNFKFGFPTDDASLIEKTKNKVAICPGSYFNIKITTPEDLVFAEAILKTKG